MIDPRPAYVIRPELFGGEVKGKDSRYSHGFSNAQFFARRNAQLGWALRSRAARTVRLANGEDIDPARCLFIDDGIPRLEKYLSQLTQPAWRDGLRSKIELVKQPEDTKSPDLYDATALAFARDSQYGLRDR